MTDAQVKSLQEEIDPVTQLLFLASLLAGVMAPRISRAEQSIAAGIVATARLVKMNLPWLMMVLMGVANSYVSPLVLKAVIDHNAQARETLAWCYGLTAVSTLWAVHLIVVRINRWVNMRTEEPNNLVDTAVLYFNLVVGLTITIIVGGMLARLVWATW